MQRWTLIGSLAGATLALGVRYATDPQAEVEADRVPEVSHSALRQAQVDGSTRPVATDVRIRTSGLKCVLTSAVRSLPESLELRAGGQLRNLSVRNERSRSGQSLGEIVIPYAILDDVKWRVAELSMVASDGAQAILDFDRTTGTCVAALPVAPSSESVDVRCPIRGGLLAPPVRSVHLWDADLLPDSWMPATAASDGDGFILFDVAPTGTAELDVGTGSGIQVRWSDGDCAAVSVDISAELCVRVPDGDLLFDDPSYRLFIEDTPVPLDSAGVGCAPARIGEAVVTQVWVTDQSARERSVSAQVEKPSRQFVDVRVHPLDTQSGALFWPSDDGPRVVSVRGLGEVAGIRNGDILVAVDGRSVEGLPMAEAVSPLDGFSSSVHITVERNDQLVDITVVFDEEEADVGGDTGN